MAFIHSFSSAHVVVDCSFACSRSHHALTTRYLHTH